LEFRLLRSCVVSCEGFAAGVCEGVKAALCAMPANNFSVAGSGCGFGFIARVYVASKASLAKKIAKLLSECLCECVTRASVILRLNQG
jgi:hypothetical protein